VVGGANTAAVSGALAAAVSNGDPVPFYLSAPGDDLAFAIALANAGQVGGLAVSAVSSTDEGLILEQLGAAGATHVNLVGSPDSFTPSLREALSSYMYVNEDLLAASPMRWSLASLDSSYRSDIVVGNATVPGSVEASTLLAVSQGHALLVLNGTEATAEVSSLLDDPQNRSIVGMGEGAIPGADALSEAAVSRVSTFPLSDATKAELSTASQVIAAGSSARRVIAASTRGVADLAVAATLAREFGGVALSQSVAESYVSLLAQAPVRVASAGAGATDAKASALDASVSTFAPPPGWRVTDVTGTEASHTIAFTPLTGATRYSAYNGDGAVVATSTTSSLTVPGVASPVAIVAESAAGAYLGTLQFKVNDYRSAADRPAAVAASTSDSMPNNLTFLGGPGLPRLVTRTAIPITGESPDPDGATVDVAITCAATFADSPSDGTVQYQYNVIALSQNPASCESAGTIGDVTIRDVLGVSFPPTEIPEAATSADRAGDAFGTDVTHAASRTVLQQLVADRTSSAGAFAERAPGDGWAPLEFRYQAFIAESKVWTPGSTGDASRPHQFFGGDNRGPDPNGGFRYRQDVWVSFGTNHTILYEESMGATHKYKCSDLRGNNCVLQQTATSPLSGLNWSGGGTNTTAKFALKNSAGNPLHALAPPIDANIAFYLNPGGTSIRGTHDAMPRHEIWFTVAGWNEWYHAYSSTYWTPGCLFGQLPTCTTRFNVGI
jgi:hypothetical protein